MTMAKYQPPPVRHGVRLWCRGWDGKYRCMANFLLSVRIDGVSDPISLVRWAAEAHGWTHYPAPVEAGLPLGRADYCPDH